ncbi:MAG: cupin domain-containing protein [Candidatus Bathyarchaeota archaeon]|nr:cupin domain-containing protein [Candidatus Bathyarchaeota archaeon]
MNNNTGSESTPNLAYAKQLSDLVTYQEGSIVSRTLIDKTAGTVTIFAFAADQSLSEHTAPFDAFVYVFDGEAEFTVSGKPERLKTGMVTIMPAGKPHAVKALSRFKMLLIMVKS